jgi:hypothetical protein
MSNTKLPHLASEQELLEALSKDEPAPTVLTSQPTFGNDIVSFLSFYDIQLGEDKVTLRMLFHLYKLWSKNPVSRETFAKQMGIYIGKSIRGYYFINKGTLKLTEEAFRLVNEQTVNKAKSVPWRRHYEDFLTHHSITTGKYYIESYILFMLYKEYIVTTDRKALSYVQFNNLSKVYFKDCKQNDHGVYLFGINEVFAEVRLNELRMKHKQKYEEKENKKKSRKVSRSKTTPKS